MLITSVGGTGFPTALTTQLCRNHQPSSPEDLFNKQFSLMIKSPFGRSALRSCCSTVAKSISVRYSNTHCTQIKSYLLCEANICNKNNMKRMIERRGVTSFFGPEKIPAVCSWNPVCQAACQEAARSAAKTSPKSALLLCPSAAPALPAGHQADRLLTSL